MPSEPAAFDYTKYEGHTPGPWHETIRQPGIHHPIYCERSTGCISHVGIDCEYDTSKANARLIAGAPLLLARCKALEEERDTLRAALNQGAPQ